jgi:hypothetical protein
MGNAASVKPEDFEKLKAEFESKKDTLSDEDLFSHMKTFYENLQAQSAATATQAPVAEA